MVVVKRVIIQPNDKTITSPIEVGLGRFTIFAGENNSGKTQLIQGIGETLEGGGGNVIKIPAERVILENETDTSSTKNPLRVSLAKLVSLELRDGDLSVENQIEDIGTVLPQYFDEFNVENITLAATLSEIEKEEYEKACKDLYIKKVLESITISDGLNNSNGISLGDAGQGTERIAVLCFLRYLQSKGISEGAEVFLVIEEPEIYLHPKLKKSFYAVLERLSEQGIKIVITTHDPFFIQLGCEAEEEVVIYRVSRTESGTTCDPIETDSFFGYPSYAEINWRVFQLPTPEYLLQLYQRIFEDKAKKDLLTGNSKKVRDSIAHTTTKKDNRHGEGRKFPTSEEIEETIKELEGILKSPGTVESENTQPEDGS